MTISTAETGVQVLALRDRLRRGLIWLTAQHQLWLGDDPVAVSDEKFSKALAAWTEIEQVYRCAVLAGCINENGCPVASPVMCDACI